jgi:hypothetical protein
MTELRWTALLLGLLGLACSSGEAPPPPSEIDDLDTLCKAIYRVDWKGGEDHWDQGIAEAHLTQPRVLAVQEQLIEGPARSEEGVLALVALIPETGASDSSIDCALIEGYAPTLKPYDGTDAD